MLLMVLQVIYLINKSTERGPGNNYAPTSEYITTFLSLIYFEGLDSVSERVTTMYFLNFDRFVA